MAAPLAVLIPTLDASETLGPVLARVFEGMVEGLVGQVVVADGGSRDGTVEAARALGCDVVVAEPGRGRQLRAGARAVRKPWMLVLHADTLLEAGWIEVVRAHIERSDRAAYFRLAFDDPGLPARLVAGWANLRARVAGLPYGDQGLLLPVQLYHEVGGYPDVPLMEDVAIARALRGRLVALPARVTTSAARYREAGWLARGARNLVLLARYFAGEDPESLALRYRGGGGRQGGGRAGRG